MISWFPGMSLGIASPMDSGNTCRNDSLVAAVIPGFSPGIQADAFCLSIFRCHRWAAPKDDSVSKGNA